MTLWPFASMAFVATVQQDRLDVASKVNRSGSGGRELGFVNGGGRGEGEEGEQEVMRDA